MTNLYQRLIAIIDDAGALGKSGKTNYGDKYAYHKIDDVEEHLRPLLVKHGVVAMVSVTSHAMSEAGLTRNQAMQWQADVELEVTFVNADDPSERETVRAWGQGIDTSDKGAGKAMSYALKNLYLATFHLRGQPDNEEHDHQRSRPAQRPSEPARVNDEDDDLKAQRKAAIAAAAREGKWNLDRAAWEQQVEHCQDEYGPGPFDVTDEQFDELLLWIKAGGEWPKGYKPLSVQAAIDADIDAAMPDSELAATGTGG